MNATVVSLFSGAGGMDEGFRQAGCNIVASNEVHPIICQTLKSNFDHDILTDSIHKLAVSDMRKAYGRPDGIVGGFPCPTYSTAADIHGARANIVTRKLRIGRKEKISGYSRYAELGGDLFLHYFRMVACLQPEWFVIENVPGLVGATIVRDTFKNTPCTRGKLPYYYNLYEGILNAADFGLPQQRPRYFFIGSVKQRDDLTQDEVRSILLRIGASFKQRRLVVGDILEKDPDIPYELDVVKNKITGEEYRVRLPEYAKRRLSGETCRDRPIITKAGERAVAPTVVAHYAKDQGTRLVEVDGVVRPYTPRECARLQGIPDRFDIAGSAYWQYVQTGNAVAVNVAKAVATGIRELIN